VRIKYVIAAATFITLIVAIRVAASLDAGALSTPALHTSVLLLRIFLVVLIVRYVLLLWLGYLHHIESGGLHPAEGAA
jgi:hypothetical protein